MKIDVLRRRIKGQMDGQSKGRKKKVPFLLLSLSGLVLVLLVFCVVQLTVVSVLSPRGEELVRLNTEKELLIEENRELEEEIAERAALGVVSSRAEDEQGMRRAEDVVYLEIESVSAEASVVNE